MELMKTSTTWKGFEYFIYWSESQSKIHQITESMKFFLTLNRKEFLLHLLFRFSYKNFARFPFYWDRQLVAMQPLSKKIVLSVLKLEVWQYGLNNVWLGDS